MGYEATVKKYLREIQKEYQDALFDGQHTAELSFRPQLHALFKGLAYDFNPSSSISVILEPKSQGRVGRPDWRIHDSNTLGIFGYIEAKGPSEESFDIHPYEQQIKKYLTLGHNLVITDGIDFVFCMKTRSTPVVVSLIDKANMSSKNWSSQKIDPQFELFMGNFFANPSPQRLSEDALVEQVAKRTRNLADDIANADMPADEAANDAERQLVELFSNIRKLIYNHNDPTLRNEKVFADFVAQVIMFSLLYAHRVLCENTDQPRVKEEKIRNFITKDLTEDEVLLPFRNLMLYIKDNTTEKLFINEWIDECIKFLSFVQMIDKQVKEPDYHELFETFLAKYDAQSRFDYGAFYTPKTLSSFVVKLTNYAATQGLDGASIYDEGSTIIDPCCGTGSFLEQIIRQDNGDSKYTLGGIEILPAPYMLANYRLSVVNKDVNRKNNHTTVLLANTLCNGVFGVPVNENTIEGKEIKRANKLSSMPLKLIIGNPPVSDAIRENVSDEFSIINEMMDEFRPPETQRHGRQNTQKQINNPFMQFIRWSCAKLLETENHSVLSFVVPLSFLDAESYQYARKYLCEHFNHAWVVAVDADGRTGVRTDSLFKTLQGRAVVVFVKKFGDSRIVSNYSFMDISQKRKSEKVAFFDQDIENSIQEFCRYDIDKRFKLVPSEPIDAKQYEKFWAVSDDPTGKNIFNKHCSGIKLGGTSLLTCVKEGMLKRRSRDILAEGISAAKAWVKDSGQRCAQDDKILDFQNELRLKGNKNAINEFITNCTANYAFRPFITTKILLWRELLQKWKSVGGGGTRYRNEILSAYDQKNTIGFSMAHAPKDIDSDLGQFVSFCWYYPDNDLCSRGNGNIYMNQYPTDSGDGFESNVKKELLQKIIELTGLEISEAAESMVYYAYAVLCSQVYLEKFKGALFTPNQSDARARIPVVADRSVYLNIAKLGHQMASLEKEGHSVANVLEYDYAGISQKIPTGFKLSNKSYFDEQDEKLVLVSDKLQLRLDCPLYLQKLSISGYPLIKNWIKFHSYGSTHCEFDEREAVELLDFLNTIAMHVQYVAELDIVMEDILEDKIGLILPF